LGRDDKKAAGSGFLLLAHSRHRPARGPNAPPPVAKIEIDNQQVYVVCRRYAPHETFPYILIRMVLSQMQIELKSPCDGTRCQSARSKIAALHRATGRWRRRQIASRISLFANCGDLSTCGLKIYMLFSREWRPRHSGVAN